MALFPPMPSVCSVRGPLDPVTLAPGAVVLDNIPCRLVPTSRLAVYPGSVFFGVPITHWADLPPSVSVGDGRTVVVSGGDINSSSPVWDLSNMSVLEIPRVSNIFYLVVWNEIRYRDTPQVFKRAYLLRGPFVPS
jgi:hypothetical protein